MNWLGRVVEIKEETDAQQERFSARARSHRLRGVPASWNLLTENESWQSYSDNHGQVRYFRVSDGAEINEPGS